MLRCRMIQNIVSRPSWAKFVCLIWISFVLLLLIDSYLDWGLSSPFWSKSSVNIQLSPEETRLYQQWFLRLTHTILPSQMSRLCKHDNSSKFLDFISQHHSRRPLRNAALFTKPARPAYQDGHLTLAYQEVFRDMLHSEGFPILQGGVRNDSIECVARERLAVIVPYRNRTENLVSFLGYMHRFLSLQQYAYRIIVVEQVGSSLFNRAKLLNVVMRELGFNSSSKYPYQAERAWPDYECVVLHDIDKLPYDPLITYTCEMQPKQLARSLLPVEVNQTQDDRLDTYYSTFFGGVTVFNRWSLIRINGGSNSFRGWGGEDDDIYKRFRLAHYVIENLPDNVGVFLSLDHKDDKYLNTERNRMLTWSLVLWRMQNDGFAQAYYELQDVIEYPLYTVMKFVL